MTDPVEMIGICPVCGYVFYSYQVFIMERSFNVRVFFYHNGGDDGIWVNGTWACVISHIPDIAPLQ